MSGFVYKWTNLINSKWYIGSHKGTVDDGYRHSSEVMLAAEKKYGKQNFIREILFEGDYESNQIRTIESAFLRDSDAAHNKMSYNRSNITGPDCVSNETRKKISANRSGIKTGPLSQEHIAKISISLTGKKRKPFSKEHRANLSSSHQGQVPWMKGKKHTPEARSRMSTTRKGRTPWNKGMTNIYSAKTLQLMSDKKRGKPWSKTRRAAQDKKNNDKK